MAKQLPNIARGTTNAACPDDADPNALKIVSNKEGFAGKSTALTAVLIDGDRAWFDEAAVHARSALEQGIEWCKELEDVPNPRRVFVCWIYVKPNRAGNYTYHGLMACEMWIDSEAQKGFKRLGQHVDRLQAAIKGSFDLAPLDIPAREALRAELLTHPGVLEASSAELQQQLPS